MFCLRSWLPLLFIPTNAPPIFIFIFFFLNFFLSRPCVYCSFLLLILCLTSCYWADHCFFDFTLNWFVPRPVDGAGGCLYGCPVEVSVPADMGMGMGNGTERILDNTVVAMGKEEWTGLGMEWARRLLGQREWKVEFLDVTVRL